MRDVAWQAAELLASQSGRRIAFIEDASNSVVPPGTDLTRGLITKIGWYPAEPEPQGARAPGTAAPGTAAPRDADLGDHVSDLFREFDFVVVNAAAPSANDLVPLAKEVDGVIVLIADNVTRRTAARELVDTLRRTGVNLLGAIQVTG